MNLIKSLERLKTILHAFEAGVIGFTSTTPVLVSCYRTIKAFKKCYPRSAIVIGGWHASALPVQTLNECPEIDFVVKGEGEHTFLELVTALEQKMSVGAIKGIAYRDQNGSVNENEDRPLVQNLDELPYPSRHLLDLDAYKDIGFYTVGGYFKKDLYLTSIVTSRGCANKCTFCADSVIYKETCRFRSPDVVVDEIEHAIKNFATRIFFFIDANFTLSPKRVKRICELIIERKVKIIWGCAARVDSISEDLLQIMKAAGCIRISYGIESGSPRVLKLMNKNITIKQIRDAVHLTKKVGIPVYVYFVYGMPGETLHDARMSRQILWELRPDYVTHSIATPFPGSDLYLLSLADGRLQTKDWRHFNYPFHHILKTPDIEAIYRFQARTLRDFYTSPFFLWFTLKNLKSIYHLGFYMRALKNLLFYMLLPR